MKTATRLDEGPEDLRKSVLSLHSPFLLCSSILKCSFSTACTCLTSFWHLCTPSSMHCSLSRAVCKRARHAKRAHVIDRRSVGISDRSVVRSEIVHVTWRVLKNARHGELVPRASFPFRSSASEVQVKWPVGAGMHLYTGVRQPPKSKPARSDRLSGI